MKASVMVDRDQKWAVILAFDVKVDKDAQKFATEVGVKIFTSEIIYHLQAKMEEYVYVSSICLYKFYFCNVTVRLISITENYCFVVLIDACLIQLVVD